MATNGVDGQTIDGGVREVSMFDLEDIPHTLTLAERFTVPPFSILDASGGWWLDRKRQWKDLGIEAEVGRDARAYGSDEDDSFLGKQISSISGGISMFDPVLTELAYRWFCPPGGDIIDTFAGGTVRGAIAAYLGYNYHGVDLSQRQIDANLSNMVAMQDGGIKFPGTVQWTQGDSLVTVPAVAGAGSKDFLFSCPPYADLEVYSDGPADISAMNYDDFMVAYRQIIQVGVERLKPDTFAAFVVTEIRNKKTGMYRNFIGDTVQAFEDAGASFYNDIILVTPVGSVAPMVGRQWEASRKIGRRHQNMLVFCVGDPKKATASIKSSL